MKKWMIRAVMAVLTAMTPIAAKADPLTITIAIAEIVGSYAVAVAIVSFVASYGFLLATIALNVYGAASARRKAAEQAAAARASYNANLVDRVTTVLQATPPWRVVYGKCIVGGDIIAIFTSDKVVLRDQVSNTGDAYRTHPDAYKHLVIHLASHEIEAFHDMLIGGSRVGPLDANGWAQSFAEGTGTNYVLATSAAAGTYSVTLAQGTGTILTGDKVFFTGDPFRYTVTVGITAPGQTATLAEPLRTTVAAGVNCTLGNEFTIRKTGFAATNLLPGETFTVPAETTLTAPPIPTLIVTGSGSADSSEYSYAQPGVDVTISPDGHAITNLSATTLNLGYQYTTYESRVRVSFHLGTQGQAADAYLLANFPSQWTANHRLPGIAYAVVTLDLEEKRFQGGPPAMAFELSGKKVFDPRTNTTVWSDNNALIIRDFLKSTWGFECSDADIDDAYTIAAANACDEVITFETVEFGISTSTTGKRYTCNGAFTTLDAPESLLNVLSDSMAGVTAYGGRWLIMPGVWATSVMDLDDDDLDGQISVSQVGAGLDALFNGAHATYLEAGRMAPSEAAPYQNNTFLAADGRELWADYTLSFTNGAARARNLLRIFTERNRDGLIISYPAKLRAWPLRVGDRVRVTSGEYGFTSKYFRVTDWQFGASTAVNLTLQEDGSASYDSADAAVVDQYPNTLLPNPYFVAPLTGIAADSGTSRLIKLYDGTIIPRVRVVWDAVTASYVIPDGHIEIAWKLVDSATWTTIEVPGDERETYITGVRELVMLNIRGVVINTLGVRSEAVYDTHQVIGKTQAPSDVAAFASVLVPGVGMKFTWAPNLEVDYLETELHLEAVWADASTPLFVGRATSFIWTTPLSGVFDVLAKHRDTSGNMSVNAAHVNTSVPVITPPADGAAGTDGVTALISNEAHTLPALNDGTVLTFAGADTYMRTFLGSLEDTANWTYSRIDYNVCSTIDFNHVTVTSWGDSCSVKLLIHADETAGTLVPVDFSNFAHTIENDGTNVVTGASNAFFGNTLQFSGNANNALKISDYSELLPGDADFAIQLQVYIPSYPAARQFLCGIWGPSSNYLEHSYAVVVEPNAHVSFLYSIEGETTDHTCEGPLLAIGSLNQVGVRRVASVLTITVISGAAGVSLPAPGRRALNITGYAPVVTGRQGIRGISITGYSPTLQMSLSSPVGQPGIAQLALTGRVPTVIVPATATAFLDTFTGTGDLSTHTSDSGMGWSTRFGGLTGTISDYLLDSGRVKAIHLIASATPATANLPATANWFVEADAYLPSSAGYGANSPSILFGAQDIGTSRGPSVEAYPLISGNYAVTIDTNDGTLNDYFFQDTGIAIGVEITVRIEWNGSVLKGYVNGSLIYTSAAITYSTTKIPYIRFGGQTSNDYVPRISRFQTGPN